MFKFISAAALTLATTTALVTPAMAEVQNDAETLAIGGFLDNRTFDRGQLQASHWAKYWQPVFDTLLRIDAEGNISGNVATDYSFAEDGSSLTLILREGLSFTNGEPVDGAAVKANIEFLQNATGQNKWMVGGISEVEVVSPTEVVLHIAEPNPALLFGLATVGGALAAPSTLGTDEAKTVPVGSGPYVYDTEASVVGRQYVYKRNPDYWNPQDFPFEQITITPIRDMSARMNALRSGQIDAGVGDPRAASEAEATGLTVASNPNNFFGIFIADRAGEMVPALGDVRVRQAINMAFDRASILEYIDNGYGEVTNQPLVSPNALNNPDLEGSYDYDPEAARALLAEAGYADGFNVSMPEVASMASYNPIIEQQLAQIGITVDWVKISPTGTIPELLSGKYPMFLFRLGTQTAWGDVLKYIGPDAPWNPSGSQTDALDKLILEARNAPLENQDAAFQAITTYLVENAWFAPWYQIDAVYFTNDEVRVVVPSHNITPWIYDFQKTGN